MDLINLKYTSRYQRRQEKFKDISPIPEIQANPQEYFSLCSKTMIRLLKQIFFHHSKRNIFSISQQWLAGRCGVTRQYLNRLLGELEEAGVIKMLYVHKSKSFYRVSSFFTNGIIASLSSLWRAWPLAMLISNVPSNAAISKSRQLLNEDSFIYNPSLANPTYLRDLLGAHAHARKDISPRLVDSRSSLKRKEEVVIQKYGASRMAFLPSQQKQLLAALTTEDSSEPLFSEAIQSITSLNLTTFGKIKLLAFPDFVITKTDQEMSLAGKVRDPFGFFMMTAMKLCRSSGIQPDWKWVNAIKEKLNLSDQTPTLVEVPQERIPQKGTGNTGQQSVRRSNSINPKEHNDSIIKQYAPHLIGVSSKKQTIEEELEELKTTDPKRYAWRVKYQKDLLVACGRDPETGDALPGFDQEKAAKILRHLF